MSTNFTKYLQYLKKLNPCPTEDGPREGYFDFDWGKVMGPKIRYYMEEAGLIKHRDGRVLLTEAGEQQLTNATGSATACPSAH